MTTKQIIIAGLLLIFSFCVTMIIIDLVNADDTPFSDPYASDFRPIEYRSMESFEPPPPVDLDQLETDLLEHGWEPARVNDIMQDLRSGQVAYDAACDRWYGR